MLEKKKKVLIISYHFPPSNIIGAVRMGKFAKYLSEFGWEPVVLTTETVRGIPDTLPLEIDKESVIRAHDHSFNERFTHKLIGNYNNYLIDSNRPKNKNRLNPKEIALNCIRLARPIYTTPFMYRLLFEPMGWYRYAVRAGLEVIKNNQIDLIFSTFPPAVDHMIAAQIHKQTVIPWIADFRDPWSVRKQPEPYYFFDKQWEKRTLKLSNILISISPTLVRKLESFHSKQTILITNGFDESDYKGDVTITPRFNITFTGNIYPGKRDPSNLFQALAQLRNKGIISPENIEIRFFGSNVGAYIPSFAEKWGVVDFVKIGGNMDFKESIKRQMESAALLSLEWNDPTESGTYSGKIFEYFGAGKPILALGFKGGDLDILLQDTGCGVMTNNVTEIESILLKWLEEFSVNKKLSYYYHPNQEVIGKYTRREQTRKLAQVFDDVLSRSKVR
jgi:glycosyltransferase involved in cell wall biosynthesis